MRLRWYGHVIHRPDEHLTIKVLQLKSEPSDRCRLRFTCILTISKDLREEKVNPTTIQNRRLWRRGIRRADPHQKRGQARQRRPLSKFLDLQVLLTISKDGRMAAGPHDGLTCSPKVWRGLNMLRTITNHQRCLQPLQLPCAIITVAPFSKRNAFQ